MIPAARASPRTLIMVRNLSLQKEPEAVVVSIFWHILMLCFHIFWFCMFLCQDLLLNIRFLVELKSSCDLQDPIDGHNQCDVIGRQSH